MQKAIDAAYWLGTHRLVLMAVAGSLGTLSRYCLTVFVQRLCGPGLSTGTFVVNVSGCLVFGFVWTLAEEWQAISENSRLIILTGFIGGLHDVFRRFAFDTAEMFAHAIWWRAAVNLVLSTVVGIAAFLLGFAIGRAV